MILHLLVTKCSGEKELIPLYSATLQECFGEVNQKILAMGTGQVTNVLLV